MKNVFLDPDNLHSLKSCVSQVEVIFTSMEGSLFKELNEL